MRSSGASPVQPVQLVVVAAAAAVLHKARPRLRRGAARTVRNCMSHATRGSREPCKPGLGKLRREPCNTQRLAKPVQQSGAAPAGRRWAAAPLPGGCSPWPAPPRRPAPQGRMDAVTLYRTVTPLGAACQASPLRRSAGAGGMHALRPTSIVLPSDRARVLPLTLSTAAWRAVSRPEEKALREGRQRGTCAKEATCGEPHGRRRLGIHYRAQTAAMGAPW